MRGKEWLQGFALRELEKFDAYGLVDMDAVVKLEELRVFNLEENGGLVETKFPNPLFKKKLKRQGDLIA